LIRAGCENGPWRDGSEECGDHDSFVRTLEMTKYVNEVLASRLVNRTQASRLENRRSNAAAGVTRNHDFADLMIDFRSAN